MTLPAITRNWVFTANGASSVNQTIVLAGSTAIVQAHLAWHWKNTLCGFAQGPWTVVQSKNGLGQWGAADHWTNTAALGALSALNPCWIVLQNTWGGRTAQLLLQLYNPFNSSCTAFAWFTSGTQASDLFPASVGGAPPVVPATAMKFLGDQTTNDLLMWDFTAGTVRLHVQQTWDAGGQGVESLRWMVAKAGAVVGWAMLDRLVGVPQGGAAWPNCDVGYWGGRVSSYPMWLNNFLQDSVYQLHAVHEAKRFCPNMAIEANINTVANHLNSGAAHALSGKLGMGPVFAVGATRGAINSNDMTPPLTGLLGRFADMWLGSSARSTGDVYPAAPALPTHAHWYNFVWPWDPAAGAPLFT